MTSCSTMAQLRRSRHSNDRPRAVGSRRRGHPASTPPPPPRASAPDSNASPDGDWLTLTDLGRVYGISTLHTGRLLIGAGLRQINGEPSASAVGRGLARPSQDIPRGQPALWDRLGCGAQLEQLGQVPRGEQNLVGLWADLLTALQQGSASISTSMEEMAEDVPSDLVQPVNQELRQRGCSFQVRLKPAAAPPPACSPAPGPDATAPHPHG